MFLVFLLRVTALFFFISWPSWGALGGIFGVILSNVYLILQNCSIFSHQTLYRCSWYNPDGHYIQKTFYIMPSLCWESFWGVLGPIFAYVHIFSRYPFNILSWNFAQVFLVWPWLSLIISFWHHVSIFRGHLRVFWGLFWHITSTFWEPFNMVCEILYRCSWCSFWGSLHYFFSISWPSWGALGDYFWDNFGQCLSNNS